MDIIKSVSSRRRQRVAHAVKVAVVLTTAVLLSLGLTRNRSTALLRRLLPRMILVSVFGGLTSLFQIVRALLTPCRNVTDYLFRWMLRPTLDAETAPPPERHARLDPEARHWILQGCSGFSFR